MGLEPELYDHLLTSGELAHQWLRHRPDEWLQELGTACLHFGPIRDAELIHGLDMEAVDQPYLAQFVLCTGFNEVEDVLADYEEVFRICVAKELPLLCADPERWRLVNGERCPGAGAMARRYADLGGDVEYCGLPFGEMYARCFDLLGIADRSRILAVGDNLTTDHRGGRRRRDRLRTRHRRNTPRGFPDGLGRSAQAGAAGELSGGGSDAPARGARDIRLVACTGPQVRRDYIRISAANPRKAKKPTTSVTVVRKTVLATAGSIFSFVSPSGISVPHRPATNRLTIMAIPMTNPIR